jgi:hypothetical protein
MTDLPLVFMLLGGIALLGYLLRDSLNWKWALGALAAAATLWGVLRAKPRPEAPVVAPPPPPEPGAATTVAEASHAIVAEAESAARKTIERAATAGEVADIMRNQR